MCSMYACFWPQIEKELDETFSDRRLLVEAEARTMDWNCALPFVTIFIVASSSSYQIIILPTSHTSFWFPTQGIATTSEAQQMSENLNSTPVHWRWFWRQWIPRVWGLSAATRKKLGSNSGAREVTEKLFRLFHASQTEFLGAMELKDPYGGVFAALYGKHLHCMSSQLCVEMLMFVFFLVSLFIVSCQCYVSWIVLFFILIIFILMIRWTWEVIWSLCRWPCHGGWKYG